MIGHVSAVSVSAKHERQGIGKALIRGAESKLLSLAREMTDNEAVDIIHPLRMEMGVVNLRTELFPWYEAQNYFKVCEIHPNPPGFDILIADDFKDKVHLVLLRKDLVL
jgi:GNAT superfamily N-acetyltransferase